MKKEYYVYILANKYNNALYIGVTGDLVLRMYEHKNGQGSVYTSKYKVNKLVHFEMFGDPYNAITREKYLKGKSRKFKEEVIKEKNPSWSELEL